jgi:tetratricopeptide (TPR) repeat protein
VPARLRTGGIVLVPAVAVVALFLFWAADEGGYLPTTWAPSALVVLGLLAACAIGLGRQRLRLTRPAAVALVTLAGYTAWSYLSIAWADSPGDALWGSDRTLLYLLLFALFALLPWREWTARTALLLFAAGIGTVAVVTLVRLGDAGAVAGMFSDGRLTSPVGYVNGAAALFTTGALTLIALASRRKQPWWLRGALLALATAGLDAAVLSESRGWLFSLPLVALATLLLVPGRVRLVLWSLPPLAGTLLTLPALLDVFARSDAAPTLAVERVALAAAAADAAAVALPICAAVLVTGTLLALLDRRVAVPARVARGADRAGAGIALAATVAGIAIGLVATDGRPDRAIADYWDRSSSYQTSAPGSSRFGAVGSNRPDFWRVSLDAFEQHPLGGLGQDNWARYYLLHRRSGEQPRWTHSLELRLLAHSGIVGTALFAAFLAAALVAALRPRRRMTPTAAATAAIALLPLVVWFVHGSIDWFWEIPALSGPAFAFAGLATALGRPRPQEGTVPPDSAASDAETEAAPPARTAPRRSPAALAAAALGTVAALAALAAIALPYAAERETIDAAAGWVEDPGDALARLDRAASLNPLSARASLTAGVIALELGRPRPARARFDEAIARDPGDWFAHFGRALAETALGDRAAARSDLARARVLSPAEPLVKEAESRVDGGDPLSYTEAFTRLRKDVQDLTGSP